MNRDQKQKTIEVMIRYFCKAKHRKKQLCGSCSELLRYIATRLNECRLDEKNSSCFMCPDYCYHPDMRKRIKMVMQFSAPHMILFHPVLMLKHLLHLRRLHRHL